MRKLNYFKGYTPKFLNQIWILWSLLYVYPFSVTTVFGADNGEGESQHRSSLCATLLAKINSFNLDKVLDALMVLTGRKPFYKDGRPYYIYDRSVSFSPNQHDLTADFLEQEILKMGLSAKKTSFDVSSLVPRTDLYP